MTPRPDRLVELRRQRALIQEHLEWLDGEIGGEERAMSATTPPSQSQMRTSIAARERKPELPTPKARIETQNDTVIERFRVAPSDIQRDVRKGCFTYFAAALLLLAAAVVGLYFALRH
jgi:hypothetical protein